MVLDIYLQINYKILRRPDYKTEKKIIGYFTKYYMHCQKHGKSTEQFKFTLKEDVNFNYSILINIMYIDGSQILYVIDEITRFQAVKWLNNFSAKHT